MQGGRSPRGAVKARLVAEADRMAARRQQRREARRRLLSHFPSGLIWHVAITQPMSEEGVEEALRGLGLCAWCPMMRATVGDRHRRRDVERPLFPGYVLFSTRGAAAPEVRAIKGLASVLASGDGAWRAVGARDIDRLIAAEAAGAFDMTVKIRVKTFRAGDSAVVASGPLKGFPVEVLAVKAGKRVKVLMNLFGARSEAWVPFDNLECVA